VSGVGVGGGAGLWWHVHLRDLSFSDHFNICDVQNLAFFASLTILFFVVHPKMEALWLCHRQIIVAAPALPTSYHASWLSALVT
jgi:hypothetical protein